MSRNNSSKKGTRIGPNDVPCLNGSCGGKNTYRKLKNSSPETAFWILNIFVETMHELNRAGSPTLSTVYETGKDILLNMDITSTPAAFCRVHSIPKYDWARVRIPIHLELYL